jgi:hypothetical protein
MMGRWCLPPRDEENKLAGEKEVAAAKNGDDGELGAALRQTGRELQETSRT